MRTDQPVFEAARAAVAQDDAATRAILLVMDDPTAAELKRALGALSLRVHSARSEAEAVEQVLTGPYDVAIVDLTLAFGSFATLMARLTEARPGLAVVALAPAGDATLGIAAVRAGAADFMRLPLQKDEILWVVRKALHMVEAREDETPSSVVPSNTQMVGTSASIRELRDGIARARRGISTVLVRGDTGTGKELVARQLHELGDRRRGPFVKVHCAALPEALLESELFGYERGAFSGAASRKPGRVELAEGGTLFLDEIGDISPATQVKLLRLLQDREFERLGGTQTLKADVRFVTATHRPLEKMVEKGEFREDLFYRLNVVSLWVPSLAERMDDFEALAIHFCHLAAAANGRTALALDVDALDYLRGLSWPGNIRQLQNAIERLVVLATSVRVSKADVERDQQRRPGALGLAAATGMGPHVSKESSVVDLGNALLKAEKRALEKALRATNGNRMAAARVLGISRRALFYKLREHGLS